LEIISPAGHLFLPKITSWSETVSISNYLKQVESFWLGQLNSLGSCIVCNGLMSFFPWQPFNHAGIYFAGAFDSVNVLIVIFTSLHVRRMTRIVQTITNAGLI